MVVLCCWTGNLQSTHGPPVTVGERSFASAGIRDSGTVSQTTSRPPPRHRQTFDTNSKRIVFGNHIRMYVSSTSFDWGKGWNVTSAGWQVTLCDPIWHVSSVWRLRSPYCYRPFVLLYLSFGQESSLLWTHTLMPYHIRILSGGFCCHDGP